MRDRFFDLDRLIQHGRTLRTLVAEPDGVVRQAAGDPPAPGARLGLLAGSFNPPTLAHQTFAMAGLEAGGLDHVWYALSTRTVDKEVVTGAGLEDRLLLLDLLVASDPRLGVLLLNRGLYVDQARLVRAAYPDLGELVFLVGFDKIVQIFDPRYYDDRDAALEQLFALATFLVAPRGADEAPALAALLDRPENRRFADAVRPLDLPPALREVASSTVRLDLASGVPLEQVVPSEVTAFVAATGLYVDEERYARRRALIDEALAALTADLAPYRDRLRALLTPDSSAPGYDCPSLGPPQKGARAASGAARQRGTRVNIRPNRIKQKLAAGEVATILSGAANADQIDQLGPIGADGFWLEGEHGPVDFSDISDLTRACDLWGATSVLRLSHNDYGDIYRAFDRGTQGVVIPHVNTKAEAESVVEAAKFAPIGKRGLFTSRQGYGVDDYYNAANETTLLIVLIEDIVAVNNLDEILSVDHIDVFFVAPSDLAASMGIIGQLNSPKLKETIDGAIKKIVAAGKTAGTLANSSNVEHFTSIGVRCLMTGMQPWIEAGFKDFSAKAAAGAKK